MEGAPVRVGKSSTNFWHPLWERSCQYRGARALTTLRAKVAENSGRRSPGKGGGYRSVQKATPHGRTTRAQKISWRVFGRCPRNCSLLENKNSKRRELSRERHMPRDSSAIICAPRHHILFREALGKTVGSWILTRLPVSECSFFCQDPAVRCATSGWKGCCPSQ